MTAPESLHALRDDLLCRTVEWCRARSPFYRERFAQAGDFGGLADLDRLPVLFRRDVIANHASLRCDPSLPSAVQYTTGTTGESLHLYRSPAEQAFIWEFFSGQLATAAGGPASPRPLHMSLVNIYHGTLLNVPSQAYVLPVGIFDQAQASQARGVLEQTYELPGVESRVSAITGTERMVMALTAYLVADGFDLAASSVRTVALFGGHVPPSRKRLLTRLWNARVTDRYSLTEMFGGAREQGIGGPWVFDPHVVPEVVHPRTLQPVSDGVGVLLLTGLYPFVQQMPLVRYFTGDLVEVVAGVDGPQGLQVRYVGRLHRSVLDVSGDDVKVLLGSGSLYETLLDLPDVAVTPRFPDLAEDPGLELTGDLHYAVDHVPAEGDEIEEISVRLGLRYAPWMYADRVAEVVDDLVQALFAGNPELETRCCQGTLKLRVIPLAAEQVPPHDSK